MKKTVLVTGSSGTVGTALCLELMRRRYSVTGLDIVHSYWDKHLDRKTVIHDLKKPLYKLRIRRPDVIVHLAAHARVHDLVVDPRKALDNYVMTHNVLEYARKKGVKRVLFSSSREVYGESEAGQRRGEDSTHVTRIKSPYTASKYASESLIHAYRECYGIKPVIVRLSNVYGRFDVSERAVPLFIYYALRNRDISIFGDKRLDFTYTDDAVDGLVRIIRRIDKVAPNTFNITAGKSRRLADVARIIVENLGSSSKIRMSQKRVGEISSFQGDVSRAKRLLGYRPEVSLEVGLRENVEWYLQVMKIRKIYEAQRRNLKRRGWA